MKEEIKEVFMAAAKKAVESDLIKAEVTAYEDHVFLGVFYDGKWEYFYLLPEDYKDVLKDVDIYLLKEELEAESRKNSKLMKELAETRQMIADNVTMCNAETAEA